MGVREDGREGGREDRREREEGRGEEGGRVGKEKDVKNGHLSTKNTMLYPHSPD